jgi:hypothetical protein
MGVNWQSQTELYVGALREFLEQELRAVQRHWDNRAVGL